MYILSRSFFFPRSVLVSRFSPSHCPIRFPRQRVCKSVSRRIRPTWTDVVARLVIAANFRVSVSFFFFFSFRKKIQQSGKKEKTPALESPHEIDQSDPLSCSSAQFDRTPRSM